MKVSKITLFFSLSLLTLLTTTYLLLEMENRYNPTEYPPATPVTFHNEPIPLIPTPTERTVQTDKCYFPPNTYDNYNDYYAARLDCLRKAYSER